MNWEIRKYEVNNNSLIELRIFLDKYENKVLNDLLLKYNFEYKDKYYKITNTVDKENDLLNILNEIKTELEKRKIEIKLEEINFAIENITEKIKELECDISIIKKILLKKKIVKTDDKGNILYSFPIFLFLESIFKKLWQNKIVRDILAIIITVIFVFLVLSFFEQREKIKQYRLEIKKQTALISHLTFEKESLNILIKEYKSKIEERKEKIKTIEIIKIPEGVKYREEITEETKKIEEEFSKIQNYLTILETQRDSIKYILDSLVEEKEKVIKKDRIFEPYLVLSNKIPFELDSLKFGAGLGVSVWRLNLEGNLMFDKNLRLYNNLSLKFKFK